MSDLSFRGQQTRTKQNLEVAGSLLEMVHSFPEQKQAEIEKDQRASDQKYVEADLVMKKINALDPR